jgi:hypothetical protein
MKNTHDAEYQGMLVYADYDRDQVGMRIAIDHGLWYNKAENFVFLEGKIPSLKEIEECKPSEVTELFKQIRDTGNKYLNHYFVIITSEWSNELQSEEYIEALKEKRKQ